MARVGEDNDFSLRNYLEALCLQSPIKKKPQNTFYLPLFQFLLQNTVLKQYPEKKTNNPDLTPPHPLRNKLDNISNQGKRLYKVHRV